VTDLMAVLRTKGVQPTPQRLAVARFVLGTSTHPTADEVWEKGRREVTMYLPSGERWRNAWQKSQVYDGGRTVTVSADVHQIPLFVREGSGIDLGDLNREYQDALAAARQRPDLRPLDAEVAAWFAARKK
jgi:hypothetical protein